MLTIITEEVTEHDQTAVVLNANELLTSATCPRETYLFLVGALHLEAQRQLTQRRHGNRVRDLGDLAVAAGDANLLVSESHSN